jgi:predicted transposase YdaD
VHTVLRYLEAAFRQKPVLRAILRGVISEEKRRMYMCVYDEMRAEGRAEGEAEGEAKGKLLGKIEFLVELLSKRGIVLDDELRARVDRCTDEAQLQRWFDRALTATTVAAIFDEL